MLTYTGDPPCDATNVQSARALVDWHLRDLGLGPIDVTENGLMHQVLPDGLGVCRAQVLTEASWPDCAELCVLVSWTPDRRYRRDSNSGQVPDGAEEHWRDRVQATIVALESRAFVAEERGPRRTPHHHATAELVVYRLPVGVPANRQPAEAWEGVEPAPPTFLRRSWYPEEAGEWAVEKALGKHSRLPRRARADAEQCIVRSITQSVWPVGAYRCSEVVWQPEAQFRASHGVPAPGADAHWKERITSLTDVLTSAGYRVRQRARPIDAARDTEVRFLVYQARPSPGARHGSTGS
ncbi:hypothetical protein [Streptomyces violascens]|uniref:hypothetical protein n=1 Tax=Streptomyces violascens TaxID=67381 RepID=UPI0036566AB0